MGLKVGLLDGDEVGHGVGATIPYVGVREGATVGAADGNIVGIGVGNPFM